MVRNKRRTIKHGGGSGASQGNGEEDLRLYKQDFLTELEKQENSLEIEKQLIEEELIMNKYNDDDIMSKVSDISLIEYELATLRTKFNPNKGVLTSNGFVFALPNQGLQCYGNALMQMLQNTKRFKLRVSNCPGNGDDVVNNMKQLLLLLKNIQPDEYGNTVIDFTEEIQTEIEERAKMFSTILFGEDRMQDPIELFYELFNNSNLNSVFEGFGLSDLSDRGVIVGCAQVAVKPTKTSVQEYINEVFPSKYGLPEDNNVLVVYISRAGYTGSDDGVRNAYPVKINEVIQIRDKMYALKSFCSHVGSSSVKTGHYVADCNLDGSYYRFDDGRPPKMFTPNLEDNTDVSTLIYELVDEEPAGLREEPEVLREEPREAPGPVKARPSFWKLLEDARREKEEEEEKLRADARERSKRKGGASRKRLNKKRIRRNTKKMKNK
jgi:hypothetical protein